MFTLTVFQKRRNIPEGGVKQLACMLMTRSNIYVSKQYLETKTELNSDINIKSINVLNNTKIYTN